MITADDVIQKRQGTIFNRVQEIEVELSQMEKQKQRLEREKEELMIEHDILGSYDNRGSISITTTTTTIKMQSKDKLVVEDAVKKIFDRAGRPLRMVEIINELEKFGYQWSAYETAHNYIRRLHCVCKVPQTRGIYQWLK